MLHTLREWSRVGEKVNFVGLYFFKKKFLVPKLVLNKSGDLI